MFLGIDTKNPIHIAAKDNEGHVLTYGELKDYVRELSGTMLSRSIAFCMCKNTVGALVGYLGFIEGNVVPLMLDENIDPELLESLMGEYTPAYLWIPIEQKDRYSYEAVYEQFGYCLLRTEYDPYKIHDELQILMTTSGSTGSPKLVRYKRGNLECNARNVAAAFSWTNEERPVCDLGMHYTMGLNVINTHLYVGATVLLTTYNLVSSQFWDYLNQEKATNFTGVPFSYDILFRLHFERMNLPFLHTLSQGGGKLTDTRFMQLADYAISRKKRFIASFGTTETAARMACLSPEQAGIRTGSIGKAIPEGKLFLINFDGEEVQDASASGELCYSGPNVTMGYAVSKEDLQKGDEFKGTYYTGDLARRDDDGYYYITGRKNRFLKLLSYRISLDQCERLIQDRYNIECACTGTDQRMEVFIVDAEMKSQVLDYLSKKTHLFKSLFRVNVIEQIPRNSSGKILYKEIGRI